METEKVVKSKSFINKSSRIYLYLYPKTIWDHLGVLRWVLGGSQTENTRNMGKYQKLRRKELSDQKAAITKVSGKYV